MDAAGETLFEVCPSTEPTPLFTDMAVAAPVTVHESVAEPPVEMELGDTVSVHEGGAQLPPHAASLYGPFSASAHEVPLQS